MPVIALTEKGLLIDVFGKNKKIIKSDGYSVKNNILASVCNNDVIFMDLNNMSTISESKVQGYLEMKMSDNGFNVAIMGYKKHLSLFTNGKKIGEFSEIENFDISNDYFSYSQKDKFFIFDFKSNKIVFQSDIKVKSIHCGNSFVILVSDKNSQNLQNLFIWKNSKFIKLLERPNLYRIKVCSSFDEKQTLILADVEYFSDSYYADSVLYFLHPVCNVMKKENKALKQILTNEEFTFSYYQDLKKIHDFGFLKNKFFICFGDQPAALHIYSLDGFFIKKFPRYNRNKVLFNKRRNMIIDCGLGNLPGYIQVSKDDEIACKFEVLGASTIAWLNNDSHFLVAITNYFKTDNRIVVYDYYGKIVDKFDCGSLTSCAVYGPEEKILNLNKPEVAVFTEVKAAYVPPHLKIANYEPKIVPKTKNIKKKDRTIDIVKNELKESMELKKKLANKEDLTLEEENKVFKIEKLQEELKKLMKK